MGKFIILLFFALGIVAFYVIRHAAAGLKLARISSNRPTVQESDVVIDKLSTVFFGYYSLLEDRDEYTLAEILLGFSDVAKDILIEKGYSVPDHLLGQLVVEAALRSGLFTREELAGEHVMVQANRLNISQGNAPNSQSQLAKPRPYDQDREYLDSIFPESKKKP